MKVIDLWEGAAPGQLTGYEQPRLEFYPAEGEYVRGWADNLAAWLKLNEYTN